MKLKMRNQVFCVVLVLLIVALLLAAGCDHQPSLGVIKSAEETVQAVKRARAQTLFRAYRESRPFILMVLGGHYESERVFDVNSYFRALTHLRMQDGYVLDWVYAGSWLGGYPVLYTRLADEPAYASYQEHAEAREGSANGGETYPPWPDYLAHVEVDNTPEGYFELAVLRMMADQFYLSWHANYNDVVIVCDRETLKSTLPETDQPHRRIFPPEKTLDSPPRDLHKEAAEIDPRPTVDFSADGTVVVRLVTFTKWGGLKEVRFTLSRDFPHSLIDSSVRTLVEYNCHFVF